MQGVVESEMGTATRAGAVSRSILNGEWLAARWSEVRAPVLLYFSTRLALLVLSYFALLLIPLNAEPGIWHAFPNNRLLDGWARWDSGWYLSILQRGYFWETDPFASNVGFFPLYPITVKALDFVLRNIPLAMIVVSNLAFLPALVLLYRLACHRFGQPAAWRTIVLLCAFPFSFAFAAAYNESLFLLLVVAMFYFGERRQWALAATCAALASSTRLVGIVAAGALALLYLESIGFDWRRVRANVAWLALAPLGLFIYMGYLYVKFGDPIAFVHSHAQGWGGGNVWEVEPHLWALYSVVRAFLGQGQIVPIDLMGLGLATLFLLAPLISLRWLPPSYALFSFGVMLISYGNSDLGSLGRYCIVSFPVFMLAGRLLKNEGAMQVVTLVSALFLSLGTVLFANWYWAG